MHERLRIGMSETQGPSTTDRKEKAVMKQATTVWVKLAAVTAAVVLAGVTWADSLTWNVTGYTGTWDLSSTNWTGDDTVFANGDDVAFPTFRSLGVISPGRTDSHYSSRTITVDGGGVSPNSILFRPAEINYLHFAGGDIGGAAGITVDSTWDANQAQLWFDRNASYSFTGGVTVEEGCHVYYKPSTAGTYSLGTGQIHIKDVAGGQTTSINYEPTVTGTTLTTPIHAQSGTTTFNWGNAPTFTGNLTLDSNIFFNSVGGAGEYFDWNGNVILTGDRTIIGGVRDLGSAPAVVRT